MAADPAPAAMKLTKKQRKALQFKGKLEKPTKEERPAKPQGAGAGDATGADDAAGADAADSNASVSQKPAAVAGRGKKDQSLSRRGKEKLEKAMGEASKATRFITFVGNLPFKTTADELRTFLQAANPTSVRLMTNKETGKSRGFAFVEFGTSEDLRHGLKFHHCSLGGKKINVELTAGGGGNSEKRTQKIKRRREDLDKERSKEHAVKRQRGDADNVDAGGPAEATDDASTAAPRGYGRAAGDDGPSGDDEATGAKTAKKANRRKRGRGSHK
ncbi:hypothetical protein LPJ61_002678 [Coemansia biformis]|uniref:RRM domain-containing protein n=1 Tax=Coemansia biformis TaxID=1286918 RepID=A0A9W8CWZ6_9FUNG|nr:hypothetical protein LPJ61_002678 [Coemansia biformis]